MSKILSGKQETASLFVLMYRFLLVLAAVLVSVGPVQAQSSSSCYRSRDLTPLGSWSMAPGGTAFKNGDVIGRISAYAQFFLPVNHGETVEVIGGGLAVSNPYKAVPLAGMPGLGLVVRWGGYQATANLAMVGPAASVGTVISGTNWLAVMKARTQVDYTLTQNYRFELVIIDERVYQGGKLTFTETGQVTFATTNQKGAAIPQLCQNGWLDPMAALTGTVQVPELPKPVQPSCSFTTSTLYQNVPLGPVDPGQVAPYGSARSRGAEGEGRFTIRATACTKGTVLNLYFTDNRSASSTADFLNSSSNAVGVRLYYVNGTAPVRFGPAPVGSTLPSRPAISAGPIPFDNVGVDMAFTAQYVRKPNTTVSDVTAGPVNAQAVLTIMYP